ncbi:MAG: InlB B-repeat-containing protein, partial [Candidatus Methanomethylophilaceae archaeon]|nr:InlB B-repeat-containing protein [Candidatus Methanomethylophilaceae archaeon]
VSEGGYLLIRNDSTLFCYGPGSGYAPSDLVKAIDRFVSMSENGHTSYADFQRIVSRYYDMSESQRKQVSNFDKLADHCATVTLDLGQEKKTVTVPRGACAVLPEIPVPAGKILTGWTSGGKQWIPYLDAVTGDMTAVPVFEDCVTVTADPGNGDRISTVISYKGGILPYISEPAREGYAFGGWFSGDKEYVPMRTVVNADTSLAAKWLKISVLSFDSDGGSDVTGEYTAVYTRPLGDLPQVVRSGYSFNGWYYGDVLYTSETVYMFEEGITLKAGWTENGTSVLDNGKGLTVSGKIAGDTKLTVSKGNPNGSTVKSVSEACMNDHGVPADCILITIKGDGIDSGLPFRITVKAAGAPDGPADVYYYLGGVQKTQGTVENGTLAFEAYGSSVYGGVQIVFGVQTGYGILDCV